MAEIPPYNPTPTPPPTGVFTPPKKETGKVQPKKETVRINLPPKPSAAPTIKLPTLPPGGPTGAPSPTFAPTASTAAPLTRASAATAAPTKTAAAPVAQNRPTSVPPRPAVAIVPAIQPLDKILIFTATIASLAAIGIVTWAYFNLKGTLENFSS
jgi:hypothetical protein